MRLIKMLASKRQPRGPIRTCLFRGANCQTTLLLRFGGRKRSRDKRDPLQKLFK